MNEEDALLIATLARTDAAFAPVRDFDGPLPVAAYLARKAFPTRGVALPRPADELAAKRLQRLRESMAAAGLLKIHPAKTRAIGVSLSDAGEARARAIAGLPSIADSFELLRWMREWVRDEHPE